MRRARIVRIEWDGGKYTHLSLSNAAIEHALAWEWQNAGIEFTVSGESSFEVKEER